MSKPIYHKHFVEVSGDSAADIIEPLDEDTRSTRPSATRSSKKRLIGMFVIVTSRLPSLE